MKLSYLSSRGKDGVWVANLSQKRSSEIIAGVKLKSQSLCHIRRSRFRGVCRLSPDFDMSKALASKPLSLAPVSARVKPFQERQI